MRTRPKEIAKKSLRLQEILREMKGVLVAFSGGVDSTLLLKIARDVLGDNVLAVTAHSYTTAYHERTDAVRLAKFIGARHLTVASREFDLPGFVENSPDRCYVCKKSRFGDLMKLSEQMGFSFVADGENTDDSGDYRPGMRATRELGIRSPLREAGLCKSEIRFLSKKLGLPTWDKLPYACLASRIPYGTPITAEKLHQVDKGEERIRGLIPGVQLRVRHYGDTARIEIEPKALPKFLHIGLRNHVVDFLHQLGFTFVTVDLEGYTMGSLNRSINTGE